MNAEEPIREIAEKWNARAKAEGMYLDEDPWSIPPAEGSILDVPLTPEAEERIARLRAQRFERAGTAQATFSPVEHVQEEARGKMHGIAVPGTLPTAADAPPAAPQR